MMASDHDALRESSGLYVLGALEPAERAAFEAHLAGCAECEVEVRTLREVAGALVYAVPQVDPPAGLRDRVLKSVGPAAAAFPAPSITATDTPGRLPRHRKSPTGFGARTGWLAIAALLLLTVALGGYGASLRQRVSDLEGQLQETTGRLARTEQQLLVATQAADRVQLRMAVLTAPDLRQVSLAGQNAARGAAGRGFWSGTRGMVFAATALPPLPPGQTYQLWYLTSAAPVSAGLFAPDSAGAIAATFDAPPQGRAPTGLAVSLEPESGVPAPTGPLYLVGTTQ